MIGWFVLRYLPISSGWQSALVQGISVGGAMGLLQWRVLSRLLPDAHHWIAWTLAGYLLAVGIGFTASGVTLPLQPAIRTAIEGSILVLAGVVMGAVQAVALGRSNWVLGAVWSGSVGLGWVVGALIPTQVPGLESLAYFPNPISQGLWGASVGAFTLVPLSLLRTASP